MQELVPLAIMISVINAFYDKTHNNWYSNDDGVVEDKLVSLKSHNNSIDDIVRSFEEVHDDSFSKRNESLPGLRSWRRERRGLDTTIIQAHNVFIIQLRKLKQGISWSAGEKDCVYGESTDIGCNKCICMSRMVYICTTKICQKTKKNKKTLKNQCIEGTKVETKTCGTCYCMEGKIVCPLTKCDVEKYKNKELTQLKRLIFEKNGVQCTKGEPVLIDSCNKCWCIGGIVFCTMIQCNNGRSKLKLEAPLKLNKCQPGTWYSPTGNPNCRPCYCLDDKYAYCFSGHCNFNEFIIPDDGFSWQPGGGWNWQPPSIYRAKCEPGKKQRKGVCTFCTCNSIGYWTCTTNFNTCTGITSKENDAYVLGTQTNCHGCRYSMGTWECYSAQTQCSDYYEGSIAVVKSKSIFLNSKGPCSTCYADPVAGNICASDVTCAQKLYARAKTFGKCSSDASCGKLCNKQEKKIAKCLNGKCGCF